MNDTPNAGSLSQLGSLIVSGLFVIVGAITLYDTLSYTDRDSQVFPQTVAVLLIICASVSFVSRFINPSNEGGFSKGSWLRRILLIATMFITCLLMPKIGFLPAAGVAFIGGLLAAMHDRWKISTVILYWVTGAIIMFAFFALFKYALHVPLP